MALDHYVSQVHLKRFYSPALDGRMYAIRKTDLKQFTPRSQDVCRIDEGSTNNFLSEPRIIEEFLKTIEGKYNAAVSAFEAGRPDQNSIYVIAGFVSYVMTCSPAAMRINLPPLQGTVEASAKILEKQGLIPTPPEELGGKDLVGLLESGKIIFEVDPKYSQAVGISKIFERLTAFGNFRWDVLINENDDCAFFTSDFPIGNESASEMCVLNRIIPLSPTLAVKLFPTTDLPKDLPNFEFGNFSFRQKHISRKEAIAINKLLVRSAEDTIFFRDSLPWVQRFVEKNRHFRVETETIQIPHLNRMLIWSQQMTKPFTRA